MRFKGTLVLLLVGLGLAAWVYFYEIKGGEEREKAKREEEKLWSVESDSIQEISLRHPDQIITAVRTGERQWKLSAPRSLDADSEEFNRMAGSAADLKRESVLEESAADLSRYGLDPAKLSLQLKTRDGQEHTVRFGDNNPTGSSTYAALEGTNRVILVANTAASSFKKTLDELRNRSILNFDQYETQTLELESAAGQVRLVKEGESWWGEGKGRWRADSPAVNAVLSAMANTKLKEFFDEDPEAYRSLGFERPLVDIKLTFGKDKAIKHLTVGLEKSKLQRRDGTPAKEEDFPEDSELYVARDASRPDLFYVEKEFVQKLQKSSSDLRDKTLASFQRWDIDSIVLMNETGTIKFEKSGDSGDWVTGDDRKKAKWDAVNGIFDLLEKEVKEFVDSPGPASAYGIDKPAVRVVLKQGANASVDVSFGSQAADGVYARVKGESVVKVVDREILETLGRGESSFLEPPAPAPSSEPGDSPQKN